MNIEIEKELTNFVSAEYRGFTAKAYWLKKPKGDALVEIYRDREPFRRFLFPAYKVFNIQAHFRDIVDGELEGNCSGYDMAGWTGFSVVVPVPVDGEIHT